MLVRRSPGRRRRARAHARRRRGPAPMRADASRRGTRPTALTATVATTSARPTVDGARRRAGAPARRRPGRARHRAHAVPERRARRCCPRSATCTCCPTACRRARRSCDVAGRRAGPRRRSASARRPSFSRDRRCAPPGAPRPTRAVGRRRDHRRAGRAAARCCASRPTCPRASRSRSPPTPRFRRSRRVRAGRTDDFDARDRATLRGLAAGRARLLARRGCAAAAATTVGPARSFRVLPARRAAARRRRSRSAPAPRSSARSSTTSPTPRPDVVRLAGRPELPGHDRPARADRRRLRRHLARLPRQPAHERRSSSSTLFAAQRDDHDYGVQDANSTNLVPWGLAPWEALMERRALLPLRRRPRRVLGARPAPLQERPDAARHAGEDAARRRASASGCCARSPRRGRRSRSSARRARSRRCAPTRATAAGPTGFTAERDLLLAHIREHVSRPDALRHRRHALDDGLRPRRPVRGAARARSASRRRTTSRSPSRRPPRTRATCRASSTPTTTAATSRFVEVSGRGGDGAPRPDARARGRRDAVHAGASRCPPDDAVRRDHRPGAARASADDRRGVRRALHGPRRALPRARVVAQVLRARPALPVDAARALLPAARRRDDRCCTSSTRGERATVLEAAASSRVALLGFGSNVAPKNLTIKLAHHEDPEDREVLVLAGELHDLDVVACAAVTAYGAMPATLASSPGTRVRAAVLLVTPTQLTTLTWGEMPYRIGRLAGASFTVEDGVEGVELDSPLAFVSRWGAFTPDGAPAPLAAIPGSDRAARPWTQRELLDRAAEIVLGSGRRRSRGPHADRLRRHRRDGGARHPGAAPVRAAVRLPRLEADRARRVAQLTYPTACAMAAASRGWPRRAWTGCSTRGRSPSCR